MSTEATGHLPFKALPPVFGRIESMIFAFKELTFE
jgi:hypothetical protein